jgi:hypothetical protein
MFAAQFGKIEKQAGNVAPGPCDALHQPSLNGINFEVNTDDRDRFRRALSCCQSPSAPGENHVNLETCKFECQVGKQFRFAVRRSVLECDVQSLNVAGLALPLHKCIPVGRRRWRCIGGSRKGEVTDAVACRLLRAGSERQGYSRTSKRDELPPPHSTPSTMVLDHTIK